MKQTKHLRQTLWRTLLCLTVMLGFASPGWADTFVKGSTLYFDVAKCALPEATKHQVWFAGGSNSGQNVSLTNVSGKIWSCTVPNDGYTELYFKPDEKQDNDKQVHVNAQSGKDLIVIDGTNYTWSTYSQQEEDKSPSFYLHHGKGNWSTDKFDTKIDSNTYQMELTLSEQHEFGIKVVPFGGTIDNSNPWYACPNDKSNEISAGNSEYSLGQTNIKNYKTPAISTETTYIVTLKVSNNIPSSFTFQEKSSDDPVGDGEYDFYMVRSRDWNKPDKLPNPGKNGTSEAFVKDMNAEGQFGIRVTKKGSTVQSAWYANAKDAGDVKSGSHTYTLVRETSSNVKNFVLPNVGGEYTFVITTDDAGLPKTLTITAPEATDRQKELYISGTWMSDNESLDKKADRITSSGGTYNEYKITTMMGGRKFRFYSQSISNGRGNWIGAGASDHKFNDGEMDGVKEFTATEHSQNGLYILPAAGTYTITVTSYDADAKTVKFKIKKDAAKQGVYIGASFLGNLEKVNREIKKDKNGKYPVFPFTIYDPDKAMFRLATAYDNSHWCGPDNGSDKDLNMTGEASRTETTAKNSKVFKLNNTGTFELQINSVEGDNINFTITRTGDAPEKPFYFVGDLNDWFSTEFEDPSGGFSLEKYIAERDNWKFREVTAADLTSAPSAVVTDNGEGWYVFDKFPGNTLSGQFQIVRAGNENIWAADVYGHAVNNLFGDNNKLKQDDLKKLFKATFTDQMVQDGTSLAADNIAFRGPESEDKSSWSNFHKECNLINEAKIYFKPVDTKDKISADRRLIVHGSPQYLYVFYANNDDDEGDETVVAKINTGKPNTKNCFLPGITYENNDPIPAYDLNGNIIEHMFTGDGLTLTLVEKVDGNFPIGKLKEAGLDQETATKISNEHLLPNNRATGDFKYLYIGKIPKGFENPAGWKYTLSLTKARNHADRNKPVAIANNHVYFMPTIDGVCVHLNDEAIKDKKVFIDGEEYSIKDLDVKYFYRIYYSEPTADGNQYSIKVVAHRPNNIVAQNQEIYTSGEHARKNTLEEAPGSNQRDFGWKELNAYATPENVNETATAEDKANGVQLWHTGIGNSSGDNGDKTPWHFRWVKSKDRWRRQRIPKEYSNAYVQILMVYNRKNTPAGAPLKAEGTGVTWASTPDDDLTPDQHTEKMKDIINNADFVSIEPGSLTFEGDKFHHPLQGNNLYYIVDSKNTVWTGVEEIENDMIVDREVAESNAAPVYYNLQGVRVAEPTKGIFIEVKGNKSRKVLF